MRKPPIPTYTAAHPAPGKSGVSMFIIFALVLVAAFLIFRYYKHGKGSNSATEQTTFLGF